MKWTFNKTKEQLTLEDGTTIWAYSHVRNLENGLRSNSEVVLTDPETEGLGREPYSPQTFPIGNWKITGCVSHPESEPYLFPFFLSTNANQFVNIWETNSDGKYTVQTNNLCLDSGYGIHFSSSSTTLGCIRINDKKDLLKLVEIYNECSAKKEEISFEVVEE